MNRLRLAITSVSLGMCMQLLAAEPARAPAPATLEPAVDTSALPPAATPAAATAPAAKPPAAKPPGAPAAKSATAAKAPGGRKAQDRLELDATQITGNSELPRVLYVVPWKRSDLGDLTGRPVNSLLDEVLTPVDRDVFRRQNRYYEALRPDTPSGGSGRAAP